MRSLPPFVKILPLIIAAILLGEVIELRWWVAAIGAALCTLYALLLEERKESSVIIAMAVVLWALATTELRKPHNVADPSRPSEYCATITSHPTLSGRWQRCDADVLIDGQQRKIILRADTTITIHIGQQGTLYGYLNPLPEGSYGELMLRRGYVGQLWAGSREDWHPTGEQVGTIGIWGRECQQAMVERIERLSLADKEEAIVEAMLTGWRGDITPELRSSYSRAGSSHLLAISGLHIGLVAMLVWWLCWFVPITTRRGHIIRNIIASALILLYALFSGLSPSALRATIIFVVAQMALANGTSKSAINLLSGAASVMLIINPNNLYDISFQLSFVAVVGISLGYGPMMKYMGGEECHRWLRNLMGVVIVGLCSTIATLPLVAHTFSIVSLVGLFLNPLVILTAEIIVLLGFIWVTLPLDFLRPIMSTLIGGAAGLQNRLAEGAANLPWSALEVEIPRWIVTLCYLLMAAGIVVSLLWKERKVWRVGK